MLSKKIAESIIDTFDKNKNSNNFQYISFVEFKDDETRFKLSKIAKEVSIFLNNCDIIDTGIDYFILNYNSFYIKANMNIFYGLNSRDDIKEFVIFDIPDVNYDLGLY